ncbi:MAG: asparagine synthase-related protein, partial [Trebonia sp.]
MYFTLAVSAASRERCAALTGRARIADPAVLPVPGPAEVAWQSPDGRAALLRWGSPETTPKITLAPSATRATSADCALSAISHAGTIWPGMPTSGSGRTPVYARTTATRVDPVYVAEVADAVILSDRAMWAAWTADRLDDHDPLLACALLNPGFPLGSATPFRGVSALSRSTIIQVLSGAASRTAASAADPRPARAPSHGTAFAGPAATPAADPYSPRHARNDWSAAGVAAALVDAVEPLREVAQPVELSLTGGKDSRLIAAALVKAGVPVQARTHGFADHPDVVIAAEVARVLGIEYDVRVPAAPGQQVDVLGRIRATVLVADGMLSAFENVGRPDPAFSRAVTAGGHGGELLRGGYAETAAGRRA